MARYGRIVAFALGVGMLVVVAPAKAERVAVVVRPALDPARLAAAGAVGELVAGAGPTVSREAALAALETGRVRNSLLDDDRSGRRLIRISTKPAAVTIYVALPSPGRQPNSRRYPIAVVGGGYHGILTSRSTRIRGLVSIADIAPSAVAIGAGRAPTIRSEAEPDAPRALARLERRLEDVRAVRWPAVLLLIGGTVVWGLVAIGARSKLAGRAAVLAAPTALATSLLLSGAGVTEPWIVGVCLAAAVLPVTLGLAFLTVHPATLAAVLAAPLVLYLVVLAAWPEVNAISAYGPHPDEGGRFYGITNRVATILLLPALLPAALLGLAAAVPLAALALAAVGPSATGADGGGLVVLVTGFLVLALRLRGRELQLRTVVIAAGAALAAALALVALDAALGGSSHVTRAVGGGPVELAGDFARRARLSFAAATSSLDQGIFLLIGLGALVLVGLARPRSPVRDALLVAIAVSLLVNDAPIDALGYGATAATALWTWERLRPAGVGGLQ